MRVRNVRELVAERLVISLQVFAVVVKRPSDTIDGVEIGEGCNLVLVGDEGLVSTDDHEHSRVLDI